MPGSSISPRDQAMLDTSAIGLIGRAAKVGGDDTATAEAAVQGAIGVVANQGEVGTVVAGEDDLAVGVEGHAGGDIVAVDVGGDVAGTCSECGIKTAVGVVTSHGEVVVDAVSAVYHLNQALTLAGLTVNDI